MAKHWINDADWTKLLSKYIINDKHYGMWAIQIQDNKHEFYVITEDGLLLGSKLCTREGPDYSLFDKESVGLVHVAPNLIFDNIHDLGAWQKGHPSPANGRCVELKEFRLSIMEYLKSKKGDVYCCSAKKTKTREWW